MCMPPLYLGDPFPLATCVYPCRDPLKSLFPPRVLPTTIILPVWPAHSDHGFVGIWLSPQRLGTYNIRDLFPLHQQALSKSSVASELHMIGKDSICYQRGEGTKDGKMFDGSFLVNPFLLRLFRGSLLSSLPLPFPKDSA